METEYVRIDEDLRAKLGPLYGYQKPKNELKIEAYKLYEEDCKGIVAISKHHEMGFNKAMEAFGDIAKESCRRNFVTYLNDPVRKENIENHFKGMILKFPGDKIDSDVAKFVYKFACEVSDSNEPPYSKRAWSGNNQPERCTWTAKKMKYGL